MGRNRRAITISVDAELLDFFEDRIGRGKRFPKRSHAFEHGLILLKSRILEEERILQEAGL